MTIKRRIFLASGAAAGVAAIGQLSKQAMAARTSTPASPLLVTQANRALNLYSARHYDTDQTIYDSFTRKTGIQVRLVEADADKLIERIKSEGANSPADVLITVDAARLWRAKEAGILQPIKSDVLIKAVPESVRDPEGLWFGLSERARVIMYNKDKVSPSELSTYEDLASEKWRGRLISRTSSHVYNLSLTGSIIAAVGTAKTEEWARGVVANFARKPEGNDTAQIRAVAAGVADLTFVNTYYLPRLAKSKKVEDQAVAAKIGVFFPNQGDRGTHVNICGGGVVKTARNRDAAIQFLEHLVSREAQEIFALSNSEYPVVEGIALDPVLVGYGQFKKDRLSAATIGQNTAEALKIMDRAGWR